MMGSGGTWSAWRFGRMVVCGAAVLGLLVPGGAGAQSPAPASPAASASASPGASAPAVPDGFQSGTDPAWSMVLDYWWQIVPGVPLLEATGSSASVLRLTNEALPGGTTFEEDAGLVEAQLEAAAGKDVNLGLTYRRTGIGTIARISYPRDANGEHAVFLFPVCPDGIRTLDVTGIFYVSDVPGGPDQWDQVAASVNPCSTEPAPALEITPEVQALATAYLELSTASNDVINRANAPLAEGAPVKVWNRAMKKISQARRDVADGLLALPWTPELLPLAQAVADANRALADNEQIFVKAKKARQLENNLDTWQGLLGAAREPAVALRLALGLATTPR